MPVDDDLKLERSDDLRRGDRPEIQARIKKLIARALGTCRRCDTRRATGFTTLRGTQINLCDRCLDDWRALTMEHRRLEALTISTRGRA